MNQLVLAQLAKGERRILSLVVAIRNTLSQAEAGKGDLTAMVKSTLRKLIASREIVEVDGMYSLSPNVQAPVGS